LVKVTLAADQTRSLVAGLRRAGVKEIGGQLFGEQLAPSNFRVTELTVQARPGTFARFVVDLLQAARDAVRFFDRTEHRYTRYNYIGEWHSHPSFAVRPSGPDVATMRDLVHDPQFAGRLGWDAGGSHLRNRLSELAAMEIVDYPARGQVTLQGWVR
jgi:hypothetical protein